MELTGPRAQRSESAVPSLAEKKDVGVVSSHYEVHPGNSPTSVQQEVKVCCVGPFVSLPKHC